jgi:hypothetical protein
MAPSSKKNTKEPKQSDDKMNDDDEETVCAETKATKMDFIEAEMMDLHLRYEIPYINGKSHPDNDFKQHVKLLLVMTTAFDKLNLRIYDNQNERVKSLHESKWSNREYFESRFTIHDDAAQRKTLIVHRVRSKKSVTTMKNDPTVTQHLKNTNSYLRAHFWKDDEVLLRDVGFLVSYVPTKHSKEYVINEMIKSCNAYPDVEWTQAPQFKLIHSQPKVKLSGKQQTLKTHAFSIQVLQQDFATMNQFLRKIYETEHLFMPYSMKRKFPQAIARAILKQNKIIKDTWVVVMVGITREMMANLAVIIERDGVVGISDTNRTDRTGRWHILVRESSFKTIRKTLTKQISSWVNDLSVDILDNIPPDFPKPTVFQKNTYEGDDDSSSGQASYMSSCAQSYGSFDDTIAEEQYFSPPGRSYASALTGHTPPAIERITEVLVPTATRAELQANATIASLQAEIKSLRTLLLGATTPSTVTESSAPEQTTANDARMATIEHNMENMTKQFTMWMTELRQNEHGHGPPTNDSRANSSPPHDNDTIMDDKQQNKSPSDNAPTSHRSKRTDTRDTPERNAHMEGVELFSETKPSPTSTPDPLLTQPSSQNTPRSDNDGKRSLSPSPIHSPTSMTSLLAALAKASPTYPEGYDTDSPMYVYTDNGDGGLYCVGLAQPGDFHPDGTIRGPQPTDDKSEMIRQLLAPPLLNDPSNAPSPRSLSPDHTLITQAETEASSIFSHHSGPSSTELIKPTAMSPLLSLPAEEAQTGN